MGQDTSVASRSSTPAGGGGPLDPLFTSVLRIPLSTPSLRLWGRVGELPVDLLLRARDRLGALAAMLAILALLVLLFLSLGTVPDPYQPRAITVNRYVFAFQAGASFLVAVLALSRVLAARWVLVVGLLYEVYLCWLTSLAMTRSVWMSFGHLPVVTWTEALVILFPLIVPSPPGRTLVAALAAAGTRPAALFLLSREMGFSIDTNALLMTSMSPAFAVALAMFGSSLVYRISQDVAAAREMGSYRLQERLGGGGMGEVWRASHRMLQRPAAIKIVRWSLPAHADAREEAEAEALLERFEREAQITASLKSPHTVELWDFGRTDAGTFYYVMELLDGFDLERLVSQWGPVEPARAMAILSQICHSLEEAHSVGLVHRDIKPTNIFVCRHGCDYDFVKVFDFGLAKRALAPITWRSTSAPGEVGVSGANSLLGTPAFVSPEVVRGEQVDGRTDLYGVGCVAYWLLSGRLPFTGTDPVQLAAQHVNAAAPPLGALVEEALPPGLEQIVHRCLAKRPAERFANATELDAALRELMVAHPWPRARAAAWWQKHRPIETLAARKRSGAGPGSTPAPAG